MLKELRYFCIRIFQNSFMFFLFSTQCFMVMSAEPNGPIPTGPAHPFFCTLNYMPSSYSSKTDWCHKAKGS